MLAEEVKKPKNNSLASSVLKKSWIITPHDERVMQALMQKFELPEIVARILSARGIALEQAEDFLNPTIKNLLPDPFCLLDMDKAAKRIAKAIATKEKIVIYGDYDVDGATSSSLLKKFFTMLGVDSEIYIPDRIAEGYGPNTEALLSLRKKGASLVITVDCGTSSHEPIAAAKKAGLEMVVIDHHLSAETLPDAVAVVNPNRIDDSSGLNNLAAVGISFLLAVAVRKTLREQNFFSAQSEPDIIQLLDLVALGTICDVMEISGINRAFIAQGLKIAARRRNRGLAALADIARMEGAPNVYHMGFLIGPRINAGGRIGKSSLGAELLSSEDEARISEITIELDRLNKERQTIEILVLEEAEKQAEKQQGPVIIVTGRNWHQGVIGIVASRLKDKYNRPAIAISLEGGIGKGSGRSVMGADLGSAITEAKMLGLLEKGGGHKMAAGFSLKEDKLNQLVDFLNTKLEKNVNNYLENDVLKLDGELELSAITMELAYKLEQLAPFGPGNPEPRFMIKNARIIKSDVVREKHISCIIGEGGAFREKGGVKATAFRALNTPLGDVLLNKERKEMALAGKIKINRWNGREKVEFTIEDVGTG